MEEEKKFDLSLNRKRKIEESMIEIMINLILKKEGKPDKKRRKYKQNKKQESEGRQEVKMWVQWTSLIQFTLVMLTQGLILARHNDEGSP